jgi:hypothetical protein
METKEKTEGRMPINGTPPMIPNTGEHRMKSPVLERKFPFDFPQMF